MLELKKDLRIGGVVRYYLSDGKDNLMQIPDAVRKCVVFLCTNTNTGMEFHGTAFFIQEQIGETKFTHLVTAKHILEGIWSRHMSEIIYLRVNLRTGGRDFIDTSRGQWVFHPDALVDIAILPCMKLPNDMDIDYAPYPLTSSVNAEVLNEYCIGIGDDVFLPGLFTQHTGEQKNIPIIRIGNIAAMPDEPIVTRKGKMDAYLIEARSIGGLSGSPVFVHLGNVRLFPSAPPKGLPLEADTDTEVDFGCPSYLLGVMHGHWENSESNLDTFIDDSGNRQSVNMGIAIVIPISKVIEAVNQSKVKELKDKIIRKRKERTFPIEDSVNEGVTTQQFYNILKKASQPIKKPESDSKQP